MLQNSAQADWSTRDQAEKGLASQADRIEEGTMFRGLTTRRSIPVI